MRPALFPSVHRIGIRPDEPEGVVAPRPRGSRRPHTDAKVAAVRHLIEETVLTYGAIAARTGVGRASICRWTKDGGWKRPLFAPRATDTVPSARASAKLKRRTLAARLTALAERHIAELEAASCVDPEKLAEALELYKVAKLAGTPRHRPRKPDALANAAPREPMRPIGELCVADVDLRRAPRGAVNDFIDNRAAPLHVEKPLRRRRRRGGYRKGRLADAEFYRWMLEKE